MSKLSNAVETQTCLAQMRAESRVCVKGFSHTWDKLHQRLYNWGQYEMGGGVTAMISWSWAALWSNMSHVRNCPKWIPHGRQDLLKHLLHKKTRNTVEHRRTQKNIEAREFLQHGHMGLSEFLLFSALYAEVWPCASVQVTLRGAPRTLTNCDRSMQFWKPPPGPTLHCLRLLGRDFDLVIYATCRASKGSPSHLPTAGSYLESRNSCMVSGRNKLLCRKRAAAQTFKYRMCVTNRVICFNEFAKCNWAWATHDMYLCKITPASTPNCTNFKKITCQLCVMRIGFSGSRVWVCAVSCP